MKILLVEDNELNRDMLTRRLERKEYIVLCAKNGKEAIELRAQLRKDYKWQQEWR